MHRASQLLAGSLREIAAFAASLVSIFVGLACALAAFVLAIAVREDLWLLVPCLIAAGFTPLFLVRFPEFIYRWRYGLPPARRARKA